MGFVCLVYKNYLFVIKLLGGKIKKKKKRLLITSLYRRENKKVKAKYI